MNKLTKKQNKLKAYCSVCKKRTDVSLSFESLVEVVPDNKLGDIVWEAKQHLTDEMASERRKILEEVFKISDQAIKRMYHVGVELSERKQDPEADRILNNIRGRYEELKENLENHKY